MSPLLGENEHIPFEDHRKGGEILLSWAVAFLVLAIIAGILGFMGVALVPSDIAWMLFVTFLILFVISLLSGRGRTTTVT